MNTAPSPPKPSTKGQSRARNTSRRLTMWMQKTWRERSIPSADFSEGTFNNININITSSNNNKGGIYGVAGDSVATAAGTTTTPTTASRGIRSPSGNSRVSGGSRFATPQVHNCISPTSPQSAITNNNANLNHANTDTNPGESLVANVDEALGAWTSLYKFEHHFPERDSDEDDIVDTSDWILDGHQEWEVHYQRSRELLKKMYPGNSGNILSDIIAWDKINTAESNDQNSKNENDAIIDDESLLLLKFGSAVGQQEYQFASFETADFSNPDSNAPKEVGKEEDRNVKCKADKHDASERGVGGERRDRFASFETSVVSNTNAEDQNEGSKKAGDRKPDGHVAGEEDKHGEQEFGFACFATADFSTIGRPSEDEEERVRRETKECIVDEEVKDEDQNEFKQENEDLSKKEKHNETKDHKNENHPPDFIKDKADKEVQSDESQKDDDKQIKIPASDVANNAETRGEDQETPASHTIQTKQIHLSKASPAAVAAFESPRTKHNHVANADDNFEEFWQTAVEAPTPETGTFSSIGSRSTYATSPLTSSVEDGLFSPPSAFVARPGIVLERILSRDDGSDETLENDPGIVVEGLVPNEALAEDDDENEFGDFRDASRPAAEREGNEGEHDGNNGDGGVRDLSTANEETIKDQQSFKENEKDLLDRVNASFEATATPALEVTTAAKGMSSLSPFHTGITPLKKNGRCRTPTDPLQTPPTSSYTNREGSNTPLSNIYFGNQDGIEGKPQHASTSLSESAAAAAAASAAAIELPTPVTRNYRYSEPGEDDSIGGSESNSRPFSARTMMICPTNTNRNVTPDRRFQLRDINKVIDGISDEDDSNPKDEESDADNPKTIGGGDINSGEVESVNEGGEESLQDGSIQSNSIPSVVQLFTKVVDLQRRPKIIVPKTVRATSQNPCRNDAASENPSDTNTRLSMSSFYFGRSNTDTLSKDQIVSVSASEIASASVSIMSMPMMKGKHHKGSSRSEKLDEPSINSSIASPEVKFFRRNKNVKSKRLLRNQQARRISSLSNHSRNSRTTGEGDDGTFDDYSHQKLYGDPRHNAYHYYYGDDDDLAGSDCDSDELTDEESQSMGSLSNLPDQYWKHPELDHTLRELTKLEWDWLPYWQMDRLLDDFDFDHNADNIPLLQEQITNKLSELDAFYGKICKKAYRKIQPHSEALILANQAALDLQQNLKLSQIYLTRSQNSIELAKYGKTLSEDKDVDEGEEGIGVNGSLRLLELWDTHHSYYELDCIERVISEICDLENDISQRIRRFETYGENSLEDFETILDTVTILEDMLSTDPTKRLVCFDATRKRASCWVSGVLVSRLHDCLSDLAVEWCRASDSTASTIYDADEAAYSRLIKILLKIGTDHHSHNASDASQPEYGDPVKAICTSIQTSHLLEVQKAFGKALLDPTDSEIGEKSEYEQELAALESNEAYLDANRLPNWTHTLVTIRFEFEMKHGGKHPLPAIFHKLCLLLTNVLCGMHRLIEWHADTASSDDNNDKTTTKNSVGLSVTTRLEIREELRARRASIWNACIQSVEECLEEYLKYSGKKELFSKRNGTHDDSSWLEDLEGLHDVSVLSNQFLSIGPLFLEGVPEEVINDGSRIKETLYSCFKDHLRAFHVEAMTTIGNMFYREDWKVYSLQELQQGSATPPPSVDGENNSIRWIVKYISQQLQYRAGSQQTLRCRSRCNGFTVANLENYAQNSLLTQDKNPFEVDLDRMKAECASIMSTLTEISWDDLCTDERVETLLELLPTYIGEGSDDSGAASKMILKSVFEGIFPWTARLLITVDKLPSLAEEACKVMRGIVDLYVTTAFRICAGNGSNERILLGIDIIQETMDHQNGSRNRLQRSTSPIFDFGFGSKPSQIQSSKPAPVISSTAEAELCTLVLEEATGLKRLREYMVGSQKRLEGVAKLDLVDGWIRDPAIEEDTIEEDFAEATARILEMRQAASCNHIFVALGLFLATQSTSSSLSFEMIHDYTNQTLKVIPLLMTLSNRISCMRSIRGRALLGEIISVGSGWEESKLHEQANGYIEEFCDFLALLWRSLSSPGSGRRLPAGILKTLWENLLGGGYMVLLDGFSKVPYCSTEGRALMSMDVASYRSGTSPRSIAERLEVENHPSTSTYPLPKDIRPYRRMAYVDTYIKIFYFPPKDALEWINTNFKKYHRHHILSLIVNTRDAKRLTNQVMKCYHEDDCAETIRV